MKLLTLILLFASAVQANAPADSLSLQYCYTQANQNYPTAENIELQQKITELNLKIADTGYYPNVELGGKASYQSEVTDFSIPGGGGPPAVSKDQYEASFKVTQNIFNGGAVGIRKELERAKGEQQIHSSEIELHQVRKQVDQVYFGILLSQQQQKVNALLIEDLEERIKTVRSQVENGVLLPSQQHILQAELIKAHQDSATIASNVDAGYQVLSELIGEEISPDMNLSLPSPRVNYQSMQPRRPEYELFQSTEKTLEKQMDLAYTKKLPSISAFGTGAFGRPGLNFLNDDFHEYYIVGLQLRWNLTDLWNSDTEMQALKVQQQKVDQNRKAFTRQLQASLDRIEQRIASIRENIERDREIITLREQIVKESASQLENGVVTATEYVTELTQANRARLSLFINRVQLAEAQIEYATTLGVPIE
ncbi:TolC family protein [Halalkalibaculum sp. DA3122]|uniref:TolC family protein n=1 Tax=Halalkalibaculum sp. DA3122 TaxID=3373607 RepID=UPI003754F23C